MANLTPKIIRVTQTTQLDTLGKAVYFMRIQYNVDTHGPFTLDIPAAEFTAARATQEMQKVAQQLSALSS
jgi:hypothetical protein